MEQSVEDLIKDWPEEPQESARRLVDYYGPPDEYRKSELIWYNTKDGWKRTVLSNEEVPHAFPAPHNDFLEQFIDYKVPVNMYSKLAEYDGSVMVERTKGEMSARCAGTSANFLAINLAHEIITGKRTVAEAREEYTRVYRAHKNGGNPPYMESFQFPLPNVNTRDPDVQTLF